MPVTTAAVTGASAPSTTYDAPADAAATQRRSSSACAAGPAVSAPVIAARFVVGAPNGAASAEATPVVTSTLPTGAR